LQSGGPLKVRKVRLEPNASYPIESEQYQKRIADIRAKRPTGSKGWQIQNIGLATHNRYATQVTYDHLLLRNMCLPTLYATRALLVISCNCMVCSAFVVMLTCELHNPCVYRHLAMAHTPGTVDTPPVAVTPETVTAEALAAIASLTAVVLLSDSDTLQLNEQLTALLTPPVQHSSATAVPYAAVLISVCSATHNNSNKSSNSSSNSTAATETVSALAALHNARLRSETVRVVADCSSGVFSGIAAATAAAGAQAQYTWLISHNAPILSPKVLHSAAALGWAEGGRTVIGTRGWSRIHNRWKPLTVTQAVGSSALTEVDTLADSWLTRTEWLVAASNELIRSGVSTAIAAAAAGSTERTEHSDDSSRDYYSVLLALSAVLRSSLHVGSYVLHSTHAPGMTLTDTATAAVVAAQLAVLAAVPQLERCIAAAHGKERLLLAVNSATDAAATVPYIESLWHSTVYELLLVLPQNAPQNAWGLFKSAQPPLCSTLTLQHSSSVSTAGAAAGASSLHDALAPDSGAAAVSDNAVFSDTTATTADDMCDDDADDAVVVAWQYTLQVHAPVAVLAVAAAGNAVANTQAELGIDVYRESAGGKKGLGWICMSAEDFK
jgi:hypothetical protein